MLQASVYEEPHSELLQGDHPGGNPSQQALEHHAQMKAQKAQFKTTHVPKHIAAIHRGVHLHGRGSKLHRAYKEFHAFHKNWAKGKTEHRFVRKVRHVDHQTERKGGKMSGLHYPLVKKISKHKMSRMFNKARKNAKKANKILKQRRYHLSKKHLFRLHAKKAVHEKAPAHRRPHKRVHVAKVHVKKHYGLRSGKWLRKLKGFRSEFRRHHKHP